MAAMPQREFTANPRANVQLSNRGEMHSCASTRLAATARVTPVFPCKPVISLVRY